MISMLRPLYVGNALQLFLAPPAGAVKWRVLKKATNDITGMSDAGALLAYEGEDKVFVDSEFLQNDVPIFYTPFYFNGSDWTQGATVAGTPHASYADYSTDVYDFVRERVSAGLAIEVARGTLHPADGVIRVLTAPPSIDDGVQLPVVTVHLQGETSTTRGIGELIAAESFDHEDDLWSDDEGWMAHVTLEIAGWSLNPDERVELRKAIRRILIANLPVFDSVGMVEIGVQQSDNDMVSGEYSAPMYQAMTMLSCDAPVRVGGRVNPIRSVDTQITVEVTNG